LYLGLLGDKVFALGKAKINNFILFFALVFVPLQLNTDRNVSLVLCTPDGMKSFSVSDSVTLLENLITTLAVIWRT